ncbi:site-specific DNA-methyltransferase [Exiguobacterium sp. s22]|uniref:DNA-methyltransferase n=1 Tax=Exiguobacterium sp. s22 TaxID=2751272 RepID=UPI001BEB038A|nr:site-specific DNA-methyltransferase [Exiguobacterium sp. s22]
MKRIPDKSVDMILCDLPYGTTRNKWDSIIPLDKLWEQYARVIKDNGAIVLTAQTPFDKVLGASNLKLLRYEWVWQKDAGTGFLNAKKMPLKDHENILVFYKKPPNYFPQMRTGFKAYKTKKGHHGTNYGNDSGAVTESNGERYPLTVLSFCRDKQKLHPTQKPVALFEYLIKTYTNEGDVVLDNCMGSGTTAIACLNTNRNYIGFELDETYHTLLTERINAHITQNTEVDAIEPI